MRRRPTSSSAANIAAAGPAGEGRRNNEECRKGRGSSPGSFGGSVCCGLLSKTTPAFLVLAGLSCAFRHLQWVSGGEVGIRNPKAENTGNRSDRNNGTHGFDLWASDLPAAARLKSRGTCETRNVKRERNPKSRITFHISRLIRLYTTCLAGVGTVQLIGYEAP